MKGNEKLIAALNELLADELTAINQYMVHAEMCSNWGYERLHQAIQKRAMAEMHHAEKLIERILFFDGRPTVNRLNEIKIGPDVETQFKNDWVAERGAIDMYNRQIALATEIRENATREILEGILKEEDDHIDWIEAQISQIEQMGIQTYLGKQISS